MTVVMHDRFRVESLGLDHKTGGPVRTQTDGRPDDAVPRSAYRNEVDDPSRPNGRSRRPRPGGTATEPQSNESHPTGLEQHPPVHLHLPTRLASEWRLVICFMPTQFSNLHSPR